MSIDFTENYTIADMLHKLAEELHNDLSISRETCYRSAISRAYYSCFDHAKQLAYETHLPRHPKPTHKDIWEHLQTVGNVDTQTIGTIGDRLRISRLAADYHGYKRIEAEHASVALENAETIIGLFSG